MLLFAIILLGIFTLSGIIVFWMELSITNDRLLWLEERLTKLEKDAVKITFGDPYSTQNERPISKPLVEGSSKSQTKGDTGSTQTVFPKREKVLGEYQIKNGKSRTKLITVKRKPKTVNEWEDEIDLGGHE